MNAIELVRESIHDREQKRELFCQAFAAAQKQLELSDLELAQTFQTALPTIGRWSRGEAAPHPVGRNPIMCYLLGRLVEQNRRKTALEA